MSNKEPRQAKTSDVTVTAVDRGEIENDERLIEGNEA